MYLLFIERSHALIIMINKTKIQIKQKMYVKFQLIDFILKR